MVAKDPRVDAYIAGLTQWKTETELLRGILLKLPLVEAFKWRQPCYGFHGKNLVIISGFKAFCALSFFQGSLLRDAAGLLVKPGENTQNGRQMRFTDPAVVRKQRSIIRAYVEEAIDAQKAGLKTAPREPADLEIPAELAAFFRNTPRLEDAFTALPPGKQRGYILHFCSARQSATRTARIEKNIPKILAGKGFHDCVCGLSKRLPRCDGSHQRIKKS